MKSTRDPRADYHLANSVNVVLFESKLLCIKYAHWCKITADVSVPGLWFRLLNPHLAPVKKHNKKMQWLKGTASRDWDGLLVVWMDSGLFTDEPIIVFQTICCYLVFNLEFYLLQRHCTKVAALYVIGATLLQMFHIASFPQTILLYRGSEGTGNPLTNFFIGIKRWCLQPFDKFL